ncbi:von Willebrand factor A domain-containing protein 1 [Larimichthys crocea]|uniref:Uncharacterized protein n=1 Tax=Larimichthys crocea TaxID=215358 RepID=A0ACD3RH25_LARCR|nr:von Willebrand factor A domain-containing protein 1 [Larimichthys crocea]
MKGFSLRCLVLIWAMLQRSDMQVAVPATVLNCCEGDILILLDSSGSVSNYEFSRMLFFAADILRPFSLGRGHVRVGLLQVGTKPNLEFGLDVHSTQQSLQKSMRSVSQLKGDTNTEAALRVAWHVLSPTVVSVSDSSPHQIRVSWGPLQPNRVQRYVVEYGAIPSGRVQTMTLQRQQNSTLLTGLEPGTQYLVTVSAVHADGKERAMSVRACTQEAALPALADLQLTQVQHQEVQVAWHGHQEGLMGYWLSWERQNSYTSSVYLHPNSHSTRLTHFTPGSRVCVSPVYSSGRGDGICCTAERHTGWLN